MRPRVLLLSVAAVVFLLLPHAASAGVPFFGPIISSEIGQTCPLSWGALVNVINNIISFLLTMAIVFVAPLSIAYAGFLFVVNPVNAGGMEKAKSVLTHTIVGIVIALAGYLIVSAVMAALYDSSKFGATWSSLITSGGVPNCLPQAGTSGAPAPAPGVTVTQPSALQPLAKRINAFQTAAGSAGLSAVFEVASSDRKNQLVSAGVSGRIDVVSYITGEHFSVYGAEGCGGAATNAVKENKTLCTNCTQISGLSCKSSSSCSARSSFTTRLRNMPATDPAIGAWTITEAYPPTTNSHRCTCHYTGTCIDAAFR